MKLQHVGLLLVGVALAGGLAVKMTQAPTIPVVVPGPGPAPQAEPHQAVSPVVSAPVPKPSPIPDARPRPTARASAPQPVYDEPAKPVIRKSRPILTTNITRTRPTQWTPGPYQAPAGTVSAKPQPGLAAQRVEPPVVEQPVAEQPVVEQKTASEPLPPAAPAPAPRHVTLQTGMTITIRLDESLSSDRTVTGGMFEASLVEPFVVDGLAIAERGARVTGRIVSSEKARVQLGLATVATSDGQRIAISTDPWTRLIGSGDVLSAGTVIRFRLASRVTVTEQQIAGR
jgi:hypothetical protein